MQVGRGSPPPEFLKKKQELTKSSAVQMSLDQKVKVLFFKLALYIMAQDKSIKQYLLFFIYFEESN
jgi:hypothetical protein